MSTDFDPYYKWLGIPPEEQPPDHYRLLGIRRFEDNADVIQNAADQRMAHLRTFQTGAHAKDSQRILNEVSAARLCLLQSAKKAQYDAQLRARDTAQAAASGQSGVDYQQSRPRDAQPIRQGSVAPQSAAPATAVPVAMRTLDPQAPYAPAQPAPGHVPADTAVAGPAIVARRRRRKSGAMTGLLVGGGSMLVLVALACVVAIVYFATSGGDERGNGNGANVAQTHNMDGNIAQTNGGTRSTTDGGMRSTTDGGSNSSTTNKTGEESSHAGGDNSESANTIDPTNPPAYALRFDGRSHLLIEGSDRLVSPDSPFTVEMWVRLADGDAHQWLVGDLTDMNQPAVNRSEYSGWKLYYSGDTLTFTARTGLRRPLPLSDGAWHHLAVCSDGSQLHLYLDGRQQYKRPLSFLNWKDNPVPLLVGGVGTATSTPAAGLRGDIRGFRISANCRYTADYQPSNSFVRDDSTRVLLNFDRDGSQSSTVEDVSGNGHHGRRMGATWIRSDAPPMTPVDPGTVVGVTPSPMVDTPGDGNNSPDEASGAVNLLQKFNITQNTSRGNAFFGSGRLTLRKNEGASQVYFPQYDPPDRYVLKADLTRIDGDDAVKFVLLVGGKQALLTIDGWPEVGYRSGLAWIDDLSPEDELYPGAHTGKLLTNGKGSTIICRVSPTSVDVAVDGRDVYQWQGDAEQIALKAYTVPSKLILAVASYNSEYVINRLDVLPITEESPAPVPPPAFAAQQPVPPDEDQAKALDEIKSVFANDYQNATEPAQKKALADQFRKLAQQEVEKPATRYVLLDEAQRLAAEGEAVDDALAIIDELGLQFAIDASAKKLAAIQAAYDAARTSEARMHVAEVALGAVDQMIGDAQIDSAVEAARLAMTAATRVGDVDLRKTTRDKKAEVDELKKQWDVAQLAAERLKSEPDNAQANLAYGRFQAVYLDDWDKALPYLAKGSDVALKTAATADLARPNDATEDLKIAEAWHDAAKKSADREQIALWQRSLFWYRRAAVTATGLTKISADKGIDEISGFLADKGASESAGGGKPRDYAGDGLIGRVISDGRDVGLLLNYNLGTQTKHVYTMLRDANLSYSRSQFDLKGYLYAHKTTKVTVRQSAQFGSPGGYATLLIDGTPAGRVSLSSNSQSFPIELKRGEHTIQWVLYSGYMYNGTLEFEDEEGNEVPVYHTKKLLKAATAVPTASQASLNQ